MANLLKMERVAVDDKSKPVTPIKIISATVFDDPYEALRVAEAKALCGALVDFDS
jgi:hypothetical protein